jgi:hypothetical protein
VKGGLKDLPNLFFDKWILCWRIHARPGVAGHFVTFYLCQKMKKPIHLFTILLFLLVFGAAPAAIAQSAGDCGGPPSQVPPAESCPEACIYCSFPNYFGSTGGYAGNGIPPGGFCSQIQNDQWLGFIAGAASATFSIVPTNCENGNGVQAALYESCTTAPIACNGGCSGCGNQTTTIAANMIPGTNYFLLIDGFSGDICDLSISVSPPSAVQAPPVGPINNIQGPAQACPSAVVPYLVPNVVGAGAYTWSSSVPGVTFGGQLTPATFDAPEGRFVEVAFPSNLSADSVQLCVSANNSCNQGGIRCRTIRVKKLPVTVLPTVTIGPSQLPYTLPWGDEAAAAGTFETTFSSFLGCDSTVRMQVVVCQKTVELPAMEICADSCISVCGKKYCTTGNYSVNCGISAACDSVVTFALTVVGKPSVQPGTRLALTCKDTMLTLKSVPTGGQFAWYDAKGQVLTTDNVLKVNKIGAYTAQSALSNGSLCGSSTVTVKQNTQKPNVTAQGGSITPPATSVMLRAKSTTSGVRFFWTGPNGFTSQQQNPTVTATGIYIVTVTDSANGCRNSATVEVTGG